jgi:prolyl-tRNA editing enzyme YbaK/EbsC (Cys-tRNA(Pro) deacylase)
VRTIVDSDLARYAVVWAAAGHPKSVFPTTFAELLALTGGTAADVAGQEENHTS